MEITGKVKKIEQKEQGKSSYGDWTKQELIIETQGQYPKLVCITNWNNKADFNTLEIGAEVKIEIVIESKEYNNKWYTTLKLLRLNSLVKEKTSVVDNKAPDKIPSEINTYEAFSDEEPNDDDILPF